MERFLAAVLGLKGVPRQGWVEGLGISRPESVADHTFAASAICMAVSDSEGLDTARVLRMMILHDLAESETGDITPGRVPRAEKLAAEEAALSRLLDLSPALRDEYMGLWREYAARSTPEARLAHEVDKLEMSLQAARYEAAGHPPERLAPFYESADREVSRPSLRGMLAGGRR